MFEKEADSAETKMLIACHEDYSKKKSYKEGYQEGAESTLRKVIKYFSARTIDENCGSYFSRLLESEEELQELAKELENV